MTEKVLISLIVIIFGYLVLDFKGKVETESRLTKIEKNSIKADSIVSVYETKIDSIKKSSNSLFARIDSNFNDIDNSLKVIEYKTKIEIDSSTVEEALLWADSLSLQYSY